MITKVTDLDTNKTSHYFSGKPFTKRQMTQLINIGCEIKHSPSYVSSSTHTGFQLIQVEFTVVKTTTEKQEIILKLMEAS
jgi:hypothetical protein